MVDILLGRSRLRAGSRAFGSGSLRRAVVTSLGAALLLTACNGGGGGIGNATPGTTVHPELQAVEYGRLVDVYGLQVTPEGSSIALYKRDVLVGPDIQDERGTNDNKRDDEILYDFTGSDPDTLQPKLLIPRDMTGEEFARAFDALDDSARRVSSMRYGTNGPATPFSVVPRNAALRLSFTAGLGIDENFFIERDASGQIIGLRNTEAVQLLRITANPDETGGVVPLPVRVVVDGNKLLLDPVLLGTEGQQYQTRNNASGLPESPDQVGANIRIALALEGPLAIPGLREPAGLTGLNNSGRNSIIRDFRSGNSNDNSSDLSNGFARDPLPLRVVGEIVMYLERVERINSFTQEITIYKNGKVHEIDRGDVFRLVSSASGIPFASSEVVVDPIDDHGSPGIQHVRVRIRAVENLESIDPSNLAGYPSTLSAREPWLVANAPRAICVAEFRAGTGSPTATPPGDGDDPSNFLTFTPTPLPYLNGVPSEPTRNVAPIAGAIVRFTKPVAMGTVKWADTFFFAMRDLTSQDSIDDFILNRPNHQNGLGMDPAAFNSAKYRTPFLIAARVFDEDYSQTALRLQPTTGFFLDERMRQEALQNPPVNRFNYLHLVANSPDGEIRDLSGNALDLQGTDVDHSSSVVIPFTVDTRKNGSLNFKPDNLAISVVRRFASRDEDPRPSYFMPNEVPAVGEQLFGDAYPLEDLFGGFVYVDGKLQARPSARTRQVADNLNQAPVAAQSSILRWCPVSVGGEAQVASNSSTTLFGQPLQNPLNPYGCRLQTVWREVDLSLSRSDPFDFNLDVEQMYWAPFTGAALVYDEFDRMSMWLGHSEYRPAPCVGDFSSLPSLPNSGLGNVFQRNFVWNPVPGATGSQPAIESQPAPHPAYVDQNLVIDPARVVYEVNQVNRFLPLPTFQKPYFVFRDETVVEQGLDNKTGNDTGGASNMQPYILSPFNNGLGQHWLTYADPQANPPITQQFLANGFWNDCPNYKLSATSTADSSTGGLTGSIALPLLADFWTYCDSSELPVGGGYIAAGVNGWQVALTVQSSPQPNFRVYSGGRAGQNPICRGPGDTQWNTASGGYTPAGGGTPPADNTFYWIMIDMLKRQTVVTNGFIDLNNPNRVPEGFNDYRLGPFYLSNGVNTRPATIRPAFAFEFDPPLSELPSGTSVVAQFRAAGEVDATPWYWNQWVSPSGSQLYPGPQGGGAGFTAQMRIDAKPTARNFPLDPFIAGDAHIRKWDDRGNRNWWTYFYNKTVTGYVEDPNQLVDPAYTQQYTGPDNFTPRDVRYVNWRFVMANNVDANPPVSASIDTFSLTWRYQPVQ